MNQVAARAILINALVDDQLQTLCDDPHGMEPFIRSVLLAGRRGCASYSNDELIRNVTDAGLQEQNDEVNEACETLEKP